MPNVSRPLRLTGRDEAKNLMRLAGPSILEQIVVTLVQFVDTAMVGSLGATATASIGVVSTSIWLFNGFLFSLSIAFSVLVAQRVGARDEEGVQSLVKQAIFYGAIFGLLIGSLAFGISDPLPRWLRADPSIQRGATDYFRIIAMNMPLMLQVSIISGLYRGAGNTKTPMILNTTLSILNTIFNFFLIYETRSVDFLPFPIPGMGLGVRGAALGTLLATLVTVIIGHITILQGKYGISMIKETSLRLGRKLTGRIFGLAWPLTLEQVARSSAQVALTVIIAQLGEVAVAANYLGINAESLSYLPAFGFSAAATALVGQAIGAKDKDLARSYGRVATVINLLMMSATGIILFVAAEPLMTIFTRDPEVIALGSKVLRIEAFAQPMFGASIVIGGVLRGAGDTRTPFLINLFSMWSVRLVAAYFLAPIYGLTGVWIAMALELNVRGLIFLNRLRRERWLHRALPEQEIIEEAETAM